MYGKFIAYIEVKSINNKSTKSWRKEMRVFMRVLNTQYNENIMKQLHESPTVCEGLPWWLRW